MRIAAISPRNLSTEAFENFLTDLESDHNIKRIDQIDKLKSLLTFEKIDIICTFMSRIDERSLKFLENVRRTFHLEVVIMTDKSHPNEVELVRTTPHYYLLEMPYNKQEFLGVARKMIHTKNVAQRVHRRFVTRQYIDLSQLSSGGNCSANIIDLSKTGAKVHLKHHDFMALKSGELLKLDIPLEDISKNHTLHAKVIWADSKEDGVYAGLEFIPSAEVYRHLMGQF